MHLVTPSFFTGMPLKLKEKYSSTKHNGLENLSTRDVHQLDNFFLTQS